MSASISVRALNQLVGFTVQVGPTSFALRRLLATHSDYSSTYSCVARGQDVEYVIRVFDKQPRYSADEWLLHDPAAEHVWTYTETGTANLIPRTQRSRSVGLGRRTVWATVRRFMAATLKDVLAAPALYGRVEALPLALEVARGLDTLHRHDIVHGTLRASNVGWEHHAQLMDYGLAASYRGNLSNAARLDIITYVAPELLLASVERISPAADMYSYGKLLRQINAAFPPREEVHRMLLAELINSCLDVDPQARPNLPEVMDRLLETTNPRWTDATLRQLSGAVLADIDARLPDGIDRESQMALPHVVRDSTSRVAAELLRKPITRVQQMSDMDVVHLLATTALVEHRRPMEWADYPFRHDILKAVEHMRTAPVGGGSDSGPGPDAPRMDIDPQWRDEVEAASRKDLEGRGLSDDEIANRVNHQIEGARELTQTMLKSDIYVRSADVAAMMQMQCPGITPDEVRILREMGYLLALPIADSYFYPMFQFDESGLPYDCIKTVADADPTEGSSFGTAVWWFLSNPVLGRQTPAEWLSDGGDESVVVGLLTRVVA